MTAKERGKQSTIYVLALILILAFAVVPIFWNSVSDDRYEQEQVIFDYNYTFEVTFCDSAKDTVTFTSEGKPESNEYNNSVKKLLTDFTKDSMMVCGLRVLSWSPMMKQIQYD